MASGGSLAVCLLTPSVSYLAADSRYTNAPDAIRDTAEKLLNVGSTALCALSGYIHFTRTMGVAIDGADVQNSVRLASFVREADRMSPSGCCGPHALAERLFARMQGVWSALASGLDEPFGARVGTLEPLAKLLYLDRAADGRSTLASIELKHVIERVSAQYTSALEFPLVRVVYEGHALAPTAFIAGSQVGIAQCGAAEVDDERGALAFIAQVFAKAQRDPTLNNRVGGPVDVAAIGASGRRWLRKKEPAERSA